MPSQTQPIMAQQSTEETPHTARARYYNPGNAFAIKYPPVPRHVFLKEHALAFAEDTPTGLIPLDISDVLELPYPATSPLILARYLRIRGGESLSGTFRSTGVIYYVIRGNGHSTSGNHRIDWKVGDTMMLPGADEWTHAAADDALLYLVSNEPQLMHEGVAPVPGEASGRAPVHYPAERVAAELDAVYNMPESKNFSGFAVIFSSEHMEWNRNIHPTMALALNSLPPGGKQRPHRHNSVAVTLCLESEGGYSIIEGERVNWMEHAVMITPPGELHAHFNEGPNMNRFFIVQDGSFHNHTRTMGYSPE